VLIAVAEGVRPDHRTSHKRRSGKPERPNESALNALSRAAGDASASLSWVILVGSASTALSSCSRRCWRSALHRHPAGRSS
jgi:hypothetical protein